MVSSVVGLLEAVQMSTHGFLDAGLLHVPTKSTELQWVKDLPTDLHTSETVPTAMDFPN